MPTKLEYLAGLFTLCFSWQLQALETDWMELKKGSTDKTTGTAIRDIQQTAATGNTSVFLAIPKKVLDDIRTEEVVVYGKAIDDAKKDPVMSVTYEWLTDYEHDYYGLLIRFGEKPLLPVRLYLKSIESNKINP